MSTGQLLEAALLVLDFTLSKPAWRKMVLLENYTFWALNLDFYNLKRIHRQCAFSRLFKKSTVNTEKNPSSYLFAF